MSRWCLIYRYETYEVAKLKADINLLEPIFNFPYITIPQIADQLGLNARGIAKQIKNLRDEGIIKRIGPNKGGHWEVIEER